MCAEHGVLKPTTKCSKKHWSTFYGLNVAFSGLDPEGGDGVMTPPPPPPFFDFDNKSVTQTQGDFSFLVVLGHTIVAMHNGWWEGQSH